MPLLAPRRLPRKFRRRAGEFSRVIARRSVAAEERRSRRRRERQARWIRRWHQVRLLVAAEFRWWMIVGTMSIVVIVAGVLLFAPFFDVREIRVRRQDPRIDPEEVQHVLAPLFSERLVLVTRAQVSALLAAHYADLADVRISKDYPSTLTVTVTLDPIVAAATLQEPDGATGTGATTSFAYITARGLFVVSPIRIIDAPLETLVLDDWAVRPQDRSFVIEPEVLRTITLARDTLRRDFGLIPKRTTYFMRAKEFHILTERGTLWFDLQSELRVQFGRFRAFLKTVSFDAVKEYVDLRIADRVVYR